MQSAAAASCNAVRRTIQSAAHLTFPDEHIRRPTVGYIFEVALFLSGVFFTSLYELTNKSSGYKEQLSFKRLNNIKLCTEIIYSDVIKYDAIAEPC